MIERQIKDLNYIKDRIKFYTGLDVRKNTRKREYVYIRMVFADIMRYRFQMKLKTISDYLGRSHCAIIHSLKKFEELENYEPYLYKVYKYILLEMDSEELFIGKMPVGKENNIDKDILKVRSVIQKAVKALQIN
jgi:hypothetical protein